MCHKILMIVERNQDQDRNNSFSSGHDSGIPHKSKIKSPAWGQNGPTFTTGDTDVCNVNPSEIINFPKRVSPE